MTTTKPGARRLEARRRTVEHLHVRDVMSPHLVTVAPDEQVLAAAVRMSRAGVRHLPVVDVDDRCLGVVDLPTVAMAWPAGPDTHGHRTVRSVLAGRRTPLVRAEATLPHAARLMTASGLDALPVVDRDEHLAGIVTSWDLVRALAGHVGHTAGLDVSLEVEDAEIAWAWVSFP